MKGIKTQKKSQQTISNPKLGINHKDEKRKRFTCKTGKKEEKEEREGKTNSIIKPM